MRQPIPSRHFAQSTCEVFSSSGVRIGKTLQQAVQLPHSRDGINAMYSDNRQQTA
jgi:hypothetical protein